MNHNVMNGILKGYRQQCYVDYMNKDSISLEYKMHKLENVIKELKLHNDKPAMDTLTYIHDLHSKLSKTE